MRGHTLKPKKVDSTAPKHDAAAIDAAATVEFSDADYARAFIEAQSFFPRGPFLGESLELLAKRLNQAFTDEAASERERYIQAIFAVGSFLSGFNNSDGYALQFAKLQWALEDLDKGTVAPFLRKKSGRGRRFDPEEVWQARAVVALGIEALIQAGDNIDDVIKKINRHHGKLHGLVTLGGGVDFDSSVKAWHSNFMKDKAPTTRSKAVFAQLKKDFDERRRNRKSDPVAELKFLRDTANVAFARAAEIAVKFKQQKDMEESDKYAEE